VRTIVVAEASSTDRTTSSALDQSLSTLDGNRALPAAGRVPLGWRSASLQGCPAQAAEGARPSVASRKALGSYTTGIPWTSGHRSLQRPHTDQGSERNRNQCPRSSADWLDPHTARSYRGRTSRLTLTGRGKRSVADEGKRSEAAGPQRLAETFVLYDRALGLVDVTAFLK